MRKLILWVPVLMVGSLMYWTIALNFGGMSLVALSSCVLPGEDLGTVTPRDSYQMISVTHQRRVSLPSDMDTDADDVRAALTDDEPVVVDIVSDREGPRSDQRGAGDRRNDQGPGETAFGSRRGDCVPPTRPPQNPQGGTASPLRDPPEDLSAAPARRSRASRR